MTTSPGSQRDLAALIERFARTRIWVVGDIMLDEYVIGDVQRISPEAPVPVVTVTGSERRPGGAANVAWNAASLGASVALCGAVGTDSAAEHVLTACAGAGVATRAACRVQGGSTTRKVRVVSRQQHLVRMDWEGTARPELDAALGALDLLAVGPPPDAVIISDYAKGFVTPAVAERTIELARTMGVPVLVDPKGSDLTRYRGATLLKPNVLELGVAVGRSLATDDPVALEQAGRELLDRVGAGALVVTLGELGMAILEDGKPLHVVPGLRRDVYDVTGAGDTVIAVLALALAAGSDLPTAATLANAAAALVIGKIGTAAVKRHELEDVLAVSSGDKLVPRDALAARAAAWRSAGRRIVFTNGCFDLLHAGHLCLLRRAAELGDVLVVAVNSDASVRLLKGPGRPVMPESERKELIAALEFVDAIVSFEEETPLAVIEQLRPDVLVKGADYRIDEVVGRAQVEAWGGRVVLVPLLAQHSTTRLLERITSRVDEPRSARARRGGG